MKKTLTINLNGIVFNVEEDAYDKLKEYLDSIKNYFASYSDNQEILNDIEARAAEQFSAKINNAKQALTQEDVSELIKTMGTVEAIAGESNAAGHQPESKPTELGAKKFYRDPDNAILCGVAAGLAAHFNIDPILMRVAFGISVFFGGAGIILYVILCFVMPEATTSASKMEMRGEPVTLSSLKDAAQEKIETARENIKKNQAWPKTKNILQKIVRIFSLTIYMIVGVCIVISAVAGLAGLIIGFGIAIFNINSPYLDFPIHELFPGAIFYVLLLAVLLVAVIPLIFLLLLGVTMSRRKSSMNLMSALTLLMIWVIALTTSGALAIKIAPQFEEKMQAIEKTEMSSRAYNLKDFNRIIADGPQDITVIRGDEFKIEASGRAQDIDRTALNQNGQILEIKKNEPWQICLFCFTRRHPLTFKITMPALESLKASGFYKADISGFSQENFALDFDGVGETTANIFAKNLTLDLTGATKTVLTGSSSSAFIKLDGVANLDAANYPINDVEISANGASRANIWAIQDLDVKVDGASHIFYKGKPSIAQETQGAGKIESVK